MTDITPEPSMDDWLRAKVHPPPVVPTEPAPLVVSDEVVARRFEVAVESEHRAEALAAGQAVAVDSGLREAAGRGWRDHAEPVRTPATPGPLPGNAASVPLGRGAPDPERLFRAALDAARGRPVDHDLQRMVESDGPGQSTVTGL